MASTDARPVPKKNTAFRLYFDIRKNDGTLITSWAGADTELSQDGGTFADATNEATEIGTSGCGYVDLTASEMNNDSVFVKVTVTNTDALPYTAVLFPEEAGDIRTDVTQFGGTTVTGRDIGASVLLSSGTGTGQVNLSSGVVDANAVQFAGQTVSATAGVNMDTIDDLSTGQSTIITTLGTDTPDLHSKVQAIDGIVDAIKVKTDSLNFTGSDVQAISSSVTGGINTSAGTITTLDGLDTAQDAQHNGTQSLLSGVGSEVSAILTDTGTTIPSTLSTIDGKADSILSRIGSFAGTGVNTIRGYLRAIMRSNVSLPSGIGGSYDNSTDSLEAIRDRGDAAWTTATGFSTHSASDVASAMFTEDTGETYSSAVDGSVVKETADNASGGGGSATLENQEILLARTADGVRVVASFAADSYGDVNTPIQRGDSYNAAAGNAIVVSSAGFPAAAWETGTTGVFKIFENNAWNTTGSVTVTHDGTETITGQIELTTAETEALTATAWTSFEVEFSNNPYQRTIVGRIQIRESDES